MLSRMTTTRWTLVFGGSLDMVDYVIVDRCARRFQSEPELLEHGEDRRTIRIGLGFVGIGPRRPAGAPWRHVDVEVSREAGTIDDGPVEKNAETVGEVAQLGVAQPIAPRRPAALRSARPA